MRYAHYRMLLLAVVTLTGCGGLEALGPLEARGFCPGGRVEPFRGCWAGGYQARGRDEHDSFNTCPAAKQAGAALPSEAQLEPFDRALEYRALIRPYRGYVHSVRSLRLTDAGLRPAVGALSSMASYLQGFRRAQGTECALLRAWRSAGFDRPFGIATFAGVSSTSPPPAELRATRATLAKVAERARQLGLSSAAAQQFLVNSDPFR